MKQLRQYFTEQGLSIEQVAEQTGYSPLYIRNLFCNSDPPNDKLRWRFRMAFPDMPAFLLSPDTEISGEANGKSEDPAGPLTMPLGAAGWPPGAGHD